MKTHSIATCLCITGASLLCPSARAQTITVTTVEDVVDFGGAQQVANLPGPDGRVSFREAVAAANNTAGPQTIEFAIPTSDFWLVTNMALLKVENLPGGFVLTDDGTTIDFLSQTTHVGDTNPSGNEVGIFSLMSNFTLSQGAITVAGNDCVIKGLDQVQNFGYAILILGSHNHVVACHFFEPFGGLTYAAVAIRPFTSTPAVGNWIGGSGPGDGNYIASSPGVGLEITGPAADNVVVGNTLTRCHAAGLIVQYGAANTRVGGPTSAERNFISGNGTGGGGVPEDRDVLLDGADGTRIEGNYLGIDAGGLLPLLPAAVGIEMHASIHTTIVHNVISGYLFEALHQGIPIRTGIGIYVASPASGVSGAVGTIQGNFIGVAPDGLTALPNAEGIRVDAVLPTVMNVLIGGAAPGEGNVIAHSAGTGVAVFNGSTGVTISGNSIYGNGAPDTLFPVGSLGIDLAGPSGFGGVTPNDPLDGDTGGNGLQNFPVLQSATLQGPLLRIVGSLGSTPLATFAVQFFASPVCHFSGFGEGQVFLGGTSVLTDAAGNASFDVLLPATTLAGWVLTSTATFEPLGATSEFSACTPIVGGAGQAFCFGDGSTTPCPCANNGLAGRGCQNSGATGGALLLGTGVPSLAADTLSLTSSGELANASSVFLQGDATLPPLAFGDGLRCVGGNLERLYTHSASGGTVSAPIGADASIHARSAALGDTIAPGGTRYYQVYYRDPNLSFCPSPTGNSFNVSQALLVYWAP